MRTPNCPAESAMIAAMKTGDLTPELSRHLAGCESCAESFAVAQYLNRYAQSIDVLNRTPDGHMLWRTIQRRKRDAALAKMSRLMAVCYVIAAAHFVALAAWFLPTNLHLVTADIFKGVPFELLMTFGAIALAAIVLGVVCLRRLDLSVLQLPVV